jgi:protein-tyrosine phosphatase
MLLAAIFSLFAFGLAAAAVWHGGWEWILLWPATDFLVIAMAYAGGGARLLGKRRGGSLHPAAVAMHLPFLILTWGLWHVAGWARGSRDASLVAEGLWLGRRPRLRDVPGGVTLLVDLTCEFPAARHVAANYIYLSFPVLDGHIPPLADLVDVARRVAGYTGTVYLHCAQGHGRSALLAACVLIARGLAADPDEAVRVIRATRPKVQLSPSQAALLRQAALQLKADIAMAGTVEPK